jgi:hypothetical protein
MQAGDDLSAIRSFDECLCLNPVGEIAMAAWFNLATVIIRKHEFPNRAGDSIPDDEYKWHECVLKCFAKVVEVYEHSAESRPAVKQAFQTYTRAKDNVYRMTVYGLVVTDDRGKTQQRDLDKIKSIPDPIRALQLFPPKRQV